MKMLAGAVVVLAAAVLIAAGTLADALVQAANRTGDPGALAIVLGAVAGLIGLAVFILGSQESQTNHHRPPPPPPV